MQTISNDVVARQVVELIAKHCLCKPEELSNETRIGEDLRVIGDDADELLEEFSNEFGIDLSGIDFQIYFPCEGSADMHYYLTTIATPKYRNAVANALRFIESKFWKVFASNTEFKTLKISDLVGIAKNEGKGHP